MEIGVFDVVSGVCMEREDSFLIVGFVRVRYLVFWLLVSFLNSW